MFNSFKKFSYRKKSQKHFNSLKKYINLKEKTKIYILLFARLMTDVKLTSAVVLILKEKYNKKVRGKQRKKREERKYKTFSYKERVQYF